jgi:hypothetical protein
LGVGDWIDLDTFLPTIKDAARGQAPVAWVGWLFGLVCTSLALVPPTHWVLLGIGLALLFCMVAHSVRQVSARVEAQKMARLPPMHVPHRDAERPEVHLHIDFPDRS